MTPGFGPRSGWRSGDRDCWQVLHAPSVWIANHVALVFIEVVRGTPIVVQVMFILFRPAGMAFNDLAHRPVYCGGGHHHDQPGAYIREITRGAVLLYSQRFSKHGEAAMKKRLVTGIPRPSRYGEPS